MPQLLKPTRLEPVLRNKRSHHNEKPAHRNKEWPPLATYFFSWIDYNSQHLFKLEAAV